MNLKEYECPVCGEYVEVDVEKLNPEATCFECGTELKLNQDASWEDGMWHDESFFSVKKPSSQP